MSYEIEPNNRFFQANRTIVEAEIKPAHTVTFVSEVDLTEIEEVRAMPGNEKPSYTAFVAKAVALALKEFPYANRRVMKRWWLPFFGPRLQKFEKIDVTVAAERDMPGIEYCAFADIIREADTKSLGDLTHWLKDLATCTAETNTQWRTFSSLIKKLPRFLSAMIIRTPLWFPKLWVKYRGGAVLISSPAKYGVDSVLTTWTWPLGISFGFVKKRPIVKDDKLVAAPTFNLTLNFDRRVMAGAQGARFFNRLVSLLTHARTELADATPGVQLAA